MAAIQPEFAHLDCLFRGRKANGIVAGLVVEGHVGGERVVIGFDAIYGENDFELAFEHEVFEVERFAVFLDGFGPLGLAEVYAERCDFDGRRLEEFIGGDVRVHVPVVGDGNPNRDAGPLLQFACGVVHGHVRRGHVVHVEFFCTANVK